MRIKRLIRTTKKSSWASMRMGGLLEQQRSTELKKVELASSSEPTQKAIILKSYTI